jgi:hypothetical protein
VKVGTVARKATALIPANILNAAKRCGLSTPTWYVGRTRGPDRPRRKTLDDIAREVRAKAEDPS